MLLRLVFCILRFHGSCELVVLRCLLIDRNGIGLLHLLISQILREITLHHFQNFNDAAASTTCLGVLLRGGWLLHEGIETLLQESCATIIVLEHSKSLSDTTDA